MSMIAVLAIIDVSRLIAGINAVEQYTTLRSLAPEYSRYVACEPRAERKCERSEHCRRSDPYRNARAHL